MRKFILVLSLIFIFLSSGEIVARTNVSDFLKSGRFRPEHFEEGLAYCEGCTRATLYRSQALKDFVIKQKRDTIFLVESFEGLDGEYFLEVFNRHNYVKINHGGTLYESKIGKPEKEILQYENAELLLPWNIPSLKSREYETLGVLIVPVPSMKHATRIILKNGRIIKKDKFNYREIFSEEDAAKYKTPD